MPELGSLGSVRGALRNERPYRECEYLAECVIYLIAVTNAVVALFSILRASSHTCRKSGLRFTFDCTSGRLVFFSGDSEY